MGWVEKEIGIAQLEDWYNVSMKHVGRLGGNYWNLATRIYYIAWFQTTPLPSYLIIYIHIHLSRFLFDPSLLEHVPYINSSLSQLFMG